MVEMAATQAEYHVEGDEESDLGWRCDLAPKDRAPVVGERVCRYDKDGRLLGEYEVTMVAHHHRPDSAGWHRTFAVTVHVRPIRG